LSPLHSFDARFHRREVSAYLIKVVLAEIKVVNMCEMLDDSEEFYAVSAALGAFLLGSLSSNICWKPF